MSKKKIIILFILAIFVAIISLFAYSFWLAPETALETDKVNTPVSQNKNMQEAAAIAVSEATVVIPGADLINKEQQVISDLGVPVQISVMPNAPDAPKAVVVNKGKMSEQVIKITVANNEFTPKNFTVTAGAPVSLAFSSGDNKTHIISFREASMAAVAFGISPNQTKAMTFNAPSEPGEYEFFCGVPGHEETGIMNIH